MTGRHSITRGLIALWAAALLAGLVGLGLRLFSGRELADYGSYIPWGLWIAVYALLVGVALGSFLLFAAGQVFRIERLLTAGRPALLISLAGIVSGLIVVGLDLGRVYRIWRVYAFPNPSSLMAWEIWLFTAFIVILLICLRLAFRADLAARAERPGAQGAVARALLLGRRRGDAASEASWLRALALVGGAVAVIVLGANGALFGVAGARPFWHSGLIPLLFLSAGLLAGAAAVTVYTALAGPRDADWADQVRWLAGLTAVLLAVDLLIEWADVSVAFYSQPASWEAYKLVLTGSYWWVFWIVHLLLGVALPIAILALRGRRPMWAGLAAGLILVTLVSVRLNIVIPGLAVPQIEGLDTAFVEEKLDFAYFPSAVEWLVTLLAAALATGIVWIGSRVLPMSAEVTPAAAPTGPEPIADLPGGATRREFVGRSAIAGGALLASQLPIALHALDEPGGGGAPLGDRAYGHAAPENVVFSVCQMCNTQCGIKASIDDGVVVKIDGNPYSPWTLHPNLPMETPLTQAVAVDGGLCPKGQAGIMAAYDPYRIRRVLKRDGPRGSGRWKTIPFEQAVEEIVEGGRLFAGIGEEREVEGLRSLWALRDPAVMEEMGDDVKRIWDGEMTVAQFKAKHRRSLDALIDPDHPDLGPRNNQIAFTWGRMKGGRSELSRRFFGESLGSTNLHGHTTVCQGSLYFAGKAMSEQFTEGRWQKGKKAYFQADAEGSEFLIFVGASPFEGNYGPPFRTAGITDGLVDGRLKMVVVDPRFSKTAAKAWKWLPIQPGTEGALALGLMRWIFDHGRFDRSFLASANKAAADAAGESTWTNATWLVKIVDGEPEMLLRASEIGLKPVETRVDSKSERYEFDHFVALVDGRPVAIDPEDEDQPPIVGDLFVDTSIEGVRVKSGLQIIKESAGERTVAEWARECDLDPADVAEVAEEFTSHGKRAAADIHRGVSQHTNGYYNVIAWFTLNALVGNYGWKGGMCKSTTYDTVGDKDGEAIEGKPFVLKDMHPAKLKPFGITLIRHDAAYEKTTIFDGYPARRPWFPLASDVYQEIIPSIGDAYPYPIKALFLYMGSPAYALPGGHTNIAVLSDTEKLPLFVASDIVIGETSMYADYVFPDLTYLERWEFAGSHPSVPERVQPVRQPVIAPLTDTVTVYGQEMPISFESMMLGLAERLELPGFGPEGLGGRPLVREEDLYLAMAANLAAGEKPGDRVPEASPEEIDLFLRQRRHLPTTVFDATRWKAVVGADWWPRVVYLLARGGRFENEGHEGDRLAHPYDVQLNLYQEKTRNAMTGEHHLGHPRYVPGPTSSIGDPVEDPGFPLRLITFREIAHTKSRTGGNYLLLALLPENSFMLNPIDADALGVGDGDWARIVSPTNPDGAWPLGQAGTLPMVGKVRTVEGLRPGVVAFSLGHGHWAYGSQPVTIDGEEVAGDERRRHGVHANAVMRLDPHLQDVCLSDPVGGSAVFYDTFVRLERADASDARIVRS